MYLLTDNMNRFVSGLIFFALLCTHAFAEPLAEGSASIVHALNGDALTVVIPKGWVLDDQAMAEKGIEMFFYPSASDFKGLKIDTPVFAYVIPTVKGEFYTSVSNLIQMKEQQAKETEKPLTTEIEQAATLAADKASTVTIVRYATPSFPRFERVAYVENDRTIFAIILSAISPDELEKQSAFIPELVSNYKLLTSAFMPNQDMKAVSVHGKTVAPEDVKVAILHNISKTSSEKLSCTSIEGVTVQALSVVATDGFPLRSRPEYVKDDALETWEVMQCDEKQNYVIRFGFGPEDKIDYGILSMTANDRK